MGDDDASDDDSNMKTYRGVQRRAEAQEYYRMSPSLRRYDKMPSERDAAIMIQGVARVWFGRLEVAYRRALDAFPRRPAVLSSPSITASIG